MKIKFDPVVGVVATSVRKIVKVLLIKAFVPTTCIEPPPRSSLAKEEGQYKIQRGCQLPSFFRRGWGWLPRAVRSAI